MIDKDITTSYIENMETENTLKSKDNARKASEGYRKRKKDLGYVYVGRYVHRSLKPLYDGLMGILKLVENDNVKH